MMKFIPAVPLVTSVLAAPVGAEAACDKVKAQEMVKVIEASGLVERRTDDMATYYFWKTGWYQMPYEQQYNMIQGLTGVEVCLRDGFKSTLIIFLGETVARGHPGFNGPSAEVIKSRP